LAARIGSTIAGVPGTEIKDTTASSTGLGDAVGDAGALTPLVVVDLLVHLLVALDPGP
jgi:hypothetical protein